MIFRFIEPLDIESILVDKLAGSPAIFVLFAFLFIAILAARFKMPMVVLGMAFVAFAALFSSIFISATPFFNVFWIVLFVGLAIALGAGAAKAFNK